MTSADVWLEVIGLCSALMFPFLIVVVWGRALERKKKRLAYETEIAKANARANDLEKQLHAKALEIQGMIAAFDEALRENPYVLALEEKARMLQMQLDLELNRQPEQQRERETPTFKNDPKGGFARLKSLIVRELHPDGNPNASQLERTIRSELFKSLWPRIEQIEKAQSN